MGRPLSHSQGDKIALRAVGDSSPMGELPCFRNFWLCNACRSSDPWVAARPLGPLERVREVCSFAARFVRMPQVAVVAVPRAWRVWSLGVFMPWRRGWHWTRWQWLREPACGVSFTSAGLSVEPVEGVPALLALRHLSVVVVGLVLAGCELWLRCIAWLPSVLVRFPRTNSALVVLVEVLPGPACVASAVLLAAVPSLMECFVFISGHRCVALWFEVCHLVGLRSGSPRTALGTFGSFPSFSVALVGLRVPMARMVCFILAPCVLSQMVVWCASLRPSGGVIFPGVVFGLSWLLPSYCVSVALLCTDLFAWLARASVVPLALARQGVAAVFTLRAAESVFRSPLRWALCRLGPLVQLCVLRLECFSMLRVLVSQGLRPVWPVVPFQACGPLRVAFGVSLHRVLVLECFVFVPSGALVHCVVPWVAHGACDSTMCCAVCLFASFVRHFTTSLGVGGVELSASGDTCASPSLVVVPLPLRGDYFALSSFRVVVRGVGESGSRWQSLLSVRLVTVRPIGMLVLDHVVCRCCEVSSFGLTSDVFHVSVAVRHVVEHVVLAWLSATVHSVRFYWRQSELLTGVSRVSIGNCILCRVLPATEWVSGCTCGVVVPFGVPRVAGVSRRFLGLVLRLCLERVPGIEDLISLLLCWCRDSSVRHDIRGGVGPLGRDLIATRLAVGIRLSAWFLLCCPACSPGARHLRACPRTERLLPLPGTPILGSLLREHSRLRACYELTADRVDSGAEGKMVVWGSGNELFVELSCLGQDAEFVESRVGRSGVRPQLGQATVLHVLCVLGGSVSPSHGGGVCSGTGAYGFSTSRCVRGVPRVASAVCPTPLVYAGVMCVARPRLVVVALRWTVDPYWALFARLTPYFLQLWARHRRSSVSDGMRRRLWRRVLSAAVRDER
ncbi:hypothetical protein Taro_002250 [Colocasia esculenta]|uniref:Uncharacterized protein n=1 Tax=Colocasia esculenta TaxID=4460 RepID=A0A843TDI0_COLES|nr:hypothetical protein [Colocasia esculenta]